jgi:hypothetical protein
MYAAINESEVMKGKELEYQNTAAAVEEYREKIMSSSHSAALDKEDINRNQREKRGAIPSSVHTTESPEALYTAKKGQYNIIIPPHTVDDC